MGKWKDAGIEDKILVSIGISIVGMFSVGTLIGLAYAIKYFVIGF